MCNDITLEDGDDAADTLVWRPEPDAAVTQVMPARPRQDLAHYLSANGLSFRASVMLSMTLLLGVVATIVASI